MNALAIVNPSDVIAPSFARRLLAWAHRLDAGLRADAASAFARAYLHSDMAPSPRDELAVAMTALLDDPDLDVRRALAEALSGASAAPRYLVVALANDQSEVAAPLLARSPLLSDAELVHCVAIGDAAAQCAIARRPGLGARPAEALAEVGKREAALALIGNHDADLTPGVLRRLFERFGDDGETRDALFARPDAPASLKAEIAIAKANASCDFSVSGGRLCRERAERIARDEREAAIASIGAGCDSKERAELVRTLRERGALTMALLLRSLLGGRRELAAASLAELSGVPNARATAFLRDPQGQGFAALALKAGLPVHALVALRAALGAMDAHRPGRGEGLNPPLIEAVIAACEARRDPALEPILSLLWRLAAEAARTEARAIAREAVGPPRHPPGLDFSPAANEEAGEPRLAAPVEALGAGAAALRPSASLANAADDTPTRAELRADRILALDAA